MVYRLLQRLMASDSKLRPRRRPVQARARATVEAILEAAARVFSREGWNATTNRIAQEAGVGIGSLYEYFPNKQALLVALAGRHVETAEQGLGQALQGERSMPELLAAIQQAIVESQRFPSHALTLIEQTGPEGAELRSRAQKLRQRVHKALESQAVAAGLDEPDLRAQVCLELLGELTSRAMYTDPERLGPRAQQYLELAIAHLCG